MGKKIKKRWRTVPIELCSFKPIGRKDNDETEPIKDRITPSPPAPTFNEDEYTKITTPRQDVLFKKGYLGRRRVPNVTSDESAQEHQSQDSIKSDHYVNDSLDPSQMIIPPPAYIDPSTVYFINGSGYEVYDPYTGSLTVVVGPPAPQYTAGGHPILTAIPYQHVPLQPLEWFSPQLPPTQWAPPSSYSHRKRFSFDSQNCSAQSSESTGPPSSPQETELIDDSGMASQYQYSGYMYPAYPMNDVNPQTLITDTVCHAETSNKRRKQLRKRRRREGIADGGSESSCEDQCYQSGASVELTNDSKTASDSGVNTHNSGGSTPVKNLPSYGSTQLVNGFGNLGSPSLDDPDADADGALKNLDENDSLTSHIPTNDTQTHSDAAIVAVRCPAQIPSPVPSSDPHVPVDVTSGISNGDSVDTVDFSHTKLEFSTNGIEHAGSGDSLNAKTFYPGGDVQSSSDVVPIDEKPSPPTIPQGSNVDNDNKENCDGNICSKQETSNISCNSKLFSKSNLSDSKLVENSIHSCNNETEEDTSVSANANGQAANTKVDKNSSNKQSKALNAKASAVQSPKNQSKKSKSKSKSKTQQTPNSKQPVLKTISPEKLKFENNGADVSGSLKTSKKLKKNQKLTKEKVIQENQRVDTEDGGVEKVKQEEDIDPVKPSQLDVTVSTDIKNSSEEDIAVNSGDENPGAKTVVIENIAELHPSESQCCIRSLVPANGTLESKNEIELCVDVASSENENLSQSETQETTDIEVNLGSCGDGAMEAKHISTTSTDDQRVLATFIKLEQIDEAAKQDLESQEIEISKFSSCRDIEPKRPPRRKRSEKKLAENVAAEVLSEVLEEAIQKVSEAQCMRSPGRITEAVNKWLSENGGVLPAFDQEECSEEEDEDEDLRKELISTNPKNVRSNPFPALSLEENESPPIEDGKRVANSNCSIDSNNVSVFDEKSQLLKSVDDSNCTIRNRFNEKKLADTANNQIDTSNHLNKTDLKVHHSSSFPCGICCNIL